MTRALAKIKFKECLSVRRKEALIIEKQAKKQAITAKLDSGTYFHHENGLITYESQQKLVQPVFLPLGQFDVVHQDEEYDLKMMVKIDDTSGFYGADSFFVVVESDKPIDLTHFNFGKEQVNLLSVLFENLTAGKWQRLTNTYRFDKPYVLYGAYLAGKGKVEIKNIKFAAYQSAPVQKIKPKQKSTSRKRGAL